jgi:hypothetical protein
MIEIIKPGYSRITDIVSDKEALMKIKPDVLENARQRGTRVDRMCKAYVLGLPVIIEKEEDDLLFKSFQLWADDKMPDLQVATRLYDEQLMLTGEPDILWDNKGCMTVIDIKATAQASVTWALQGSAYAYLEAQNGLQIDCIQFLRLKKDGKKPCEYEYEFESNFNMFMHFYYRHQYLGKHKDELDDYYDNL